ncbi:hypothetical protein L2E82_18395 [Cichorium intybus]|uniref:Uncharacterized protein n=1 Tax=Cichorium intybus TaxID=13427 RepID=A0ACB9FBB0_CICIN|nr:hypothetical protein L2E82_18395 [Cichorium intybus]
MLSVSILTVKFVLILPVDHPIVSNFDFEAGDENALEEDELQPLQLDSRNANTLFLFLISVSIGILSILRSWLLVRMCSFTADLALPINTLIPP